MDELKDSFDYFEKKDLFSLTDAFMKYFRYWPFFLGMTLLSLFIGFLYMRYASVTFLTMAKIKIIDDTKELDIAKDPSTLFWSDSKINMDNEIEILKSYRLLDQVVNDLDLDISYYYKGTFKTSEIWNQPFVVADHLLSEEAIEPLWFEVELKAEGFHITDDYDREYFVEYNNLGSSMTGLPFNIRPLEGIVLEEYEDVVYQVAIHPKKEAVMNLTNNLQVQPSNKKSEILTLWLVGESGQRSEDILNKTIEKFNEDGIRDRQLISKRTLDFLDERFLYLSGELDSIEAGKQGYKQANNLSYIEEDATSILRKKSVAEDEVFDLETQITLSNLLKSALVNEQSYSLLPSDVGLENSSINNLVSEFNELSLERSKLMTSVGTNHPTLQDMNAQLESAKQNILKTLNVFRRQLGSSLKKLDEQKDLANDMFSRLPEKEKMLRSIERQQSIKEKLFLLLLQKREEAAVNYAITAPSIKIVDYGLTQKKPVSPKKLITYPICLFLGLAIPFLVLYVRFTFDNKIHERKDLIQTNSEIPIIGEIPFFENDKRFLEVNDRSVLAESYRLLSANIIYHLGKVSEYANGKVILVTSSVKGEGKTLTALNLAFALTSLKKKILIVGGDLRNPKLQTFFDQSSELGLSHYLLYPEIDWKEPITANGLRNKYLQVCFTGKVPHNPSELLSGNAFGTFIENAKKEYDFVVIDTAPTMLVSDTLLIAPFADITLFVTRANYTKKKLLEFSKEIFAQNKLRNMVYLLNGVGHNDKEYNYGYEYGYGEVESFEVINKKNLIYGTLKKLYVKYISFGRKTFDKMKTIIFRKNS
ncbi:polysaccharide biosynthesis tyrosine autokinase [Maribacter algarum]|uniref:non-specific protein-tyrosine kinase n=1 Tax=Maribacter algarum (ex Zhang et al. 2020) TaxID=2578118 RepID=A0A5S3PTE5_9FLAO|nr:polysaccharide biosynthesis tyrosine autokinase [Maribacter algarum]TMM58200.1 polysaccharide biosynthesis tyrosine autokinase [Maribacter algarum]